MIAPGESVLVYGAASPVGAAVVREALRQGAQVIALDLPRTPLANMVEERVQAIMIDPVVDQAALEEATGRASACILVADAHVGPSTHRELMDLAVLAPLSMLFRAADDAKLRSLVFLSSVRIFGRPRLIPVPEYGAVHPRTAYERGMLDAERIAIRFHEKHGLPVAILRAAYRHGPRFDGVVANLCAWAAVAWARGIQSLSLPANAPPCQFTALSDLARVAVALVGRSEAVGCAFHTAAPGTISIADLMRRALDAYGLDAREQPLPGKFLRRFPGFLAGSVSARAREQWKDVVSEYQLRPDAPGPELSPWLLESLKVPQVYDTSGLASLGIPPTDVPVEEGCAQYLRWAAAEGKWLPPLVREGR